MKTLTKKHYMRTANTAAVIVVLAAILTDHYPAWRVALLCVAALASAAGVYVYFRRRFEVLAGRATDEDLDAEPTSPKDTA